MGNELQCIFNRLRASDIRAQSPSPLRDAASCMPSAKWHKDQKGLVSFFWAPSRIPPDEHVPCGQANIKEPQYNVGWFKGFDLVLNGLDNLEARRHVNRLCLAAEVPLVESGTAAYLGQVRDDT